MLEIFRAVAYTPLRHEGKEERRGDGAFRFLRIVLSPPLFSFFPYKMKVGAAGAPQRSVET